MKRTQQGIFGKRLMIWQRQRSAGKHLIGPVWCQARRFKTSQVAALQLTIGNPRVHYRWAFDLWFYYKGV